MALPKEIYEGTDVIFTEVITDSAGTPINVTGYTVTLIVKPDYTTADGSASINETAALTTPASGLVTFDLTKAITAIAPGNYVAEIYWEDGAGPPTNVGVHKVTKLAVVQRVKDV